MFLLLPADRSMLVALATPVCVTEHVLLLLLNALFDQLLKYLHL